MDDIEKLKEEINLLKLENQELKKQLADKNSDWERTLIDLAKTRSKYEWEEKNRKNNTPYSPIQTIIK